MADWLMEAEAVRIGEPFKRAANGAPVAHVVAALLRLESDIEGIAPGALAHGRLTRGILVGAVLSGANVVPIGGLPGAA